MIHADQAHCQARASLTEYLQGRRDVRRILLIYDLFYKLRVILWCPKSVWNSVREEIVERLQRAASAYWSGAVLKGVVGNEYPDGPWQNEAWQQAVAVPGTDKKLKIMERQRTKEGWFQAPAEPPWAVRKDYPAIVSFYSFKGGAGRSTALAATALHLAAAGERVAVVDFDLDAPGVGLLLAGHDGAMAPWGIADYLLERPIAAEDGAGSGLDLADYCHRCPTSLFAGTGEIAVFPAGSTDRRYVGKLARLDYAVPLGQTHPFVQFLQEIREQLRPHWILIDARAGLGNASGFVMGGLCHLHVLAATLANASWRGLEMILERLGADRVRAGQPQAECVLAAAMVPRSQERQYQELVAAFTDRARDVFSNHYYAEREQEGESWSLADVESTDAPHVPVVLPYDERLALFRDLSEVRDVLLEGEPYRQLVERVRTGKERMRAS